MSELKTCEYDYVPHECQHVDEEEEIIMRGSEELFLYGADPDCEHDIRLRTSGYGCTKCRGWYCA